MKNWGVKGLMIKDLMCWRIYMLKNWNVEELKYWRIELLNWSVEDPILLIRCLYVVAVANCFECWRIEMSKNWCAEELMFWILMFYRFEVIKNCRIEELKNWNIEELKCKDVDLSSIIGWLTLLNIISETDIILIFSYHSIESNV